MNKLIYLVLLAGVLLLCSANGGCEFEDSDDVQRRQNEELVSEATSQVGMPNIKNFRERKILKDILEMRDQDGLTTYTYLVAEQTGKLVFLGESVGYGFPAATQLTNPMRREYSGLALPQADPNGLFSPDSAEGTYIMLKNPHGDNVSVVYVEPRIIVSPFRLD